MSEAFLPNFSEYTPPVLPPPSLYRRRYPYNWGTTTLDAKIQVLSTKLEIVNNKLDTLLEEMSQLKDMLFYAPPGILLPEGGDGYLQGKNSFESTFKTSI